MFLFLASAGSWFVDADGVAHRIKSRRDSGRNALRSGRFPASGGSSPGLDGHSVSPNQMARLSIQDLETRRFAGLFRGSSITAPAMRPQPASAGSRFEARANARTKAHARATTSDRIFFEYKLCEFAERRRQEGSRDEKRANQRRESLSLTGARAWLSACR